MAVDSCGRDLLNYAMAQWLSVAAPRCLPFGYCTSCHWPAGVMGHCARMVHLAVAVVCIPLGLLIVVDAVDGVSVCARGQC